jgi:hypothetical protein
VSRVIPLGSLRAPKLLLMLPTLSSTNGEVRQRERVLLASDHKYLQIRDLCQELGISVARCIIAAGRSGKLRPTLVWCPHPIYGMNGQKLSEVGRS